MIQDTKLHKIEMSEEREISVIHHKPTYLKTGDLPMLLKSHQMFYTKKSVILFFLGLLFNWHEILLQMILLCTLIILPDLFQDVQMKSYVKHVKKILTGKIRFNQHPDFASK